MLVRVQPHSQHKRTIKQKIMMDMVKNIAEVDVHVVGEYYMVPCVFDKNIGSMVPVIGTFHNDKDYLKFDNDHIHRDLRFIDMKIFDDLPIGRKPEWAITLKENTNGQIVLKKLKMKRQYDRWMLPSAPKGSNAWKDLQSAYAKCTLISGHICPHKGIGLKGRLVDTDGNITCPGHGLKFNKQTGKLVHRHE